MLEKAMEDMMKLNGMQALEEAVTGTWIKQMQAMGDQMTAMSNRMMADLGKSGFEPGMFKVMDPFTLVDKMPRPDKQIFDAPEQYMFNPAALGAHMMTTGLAMQQAMIAAGMEMMTPAGVNKR